MKGSTGLSRSFPVAVGVHARSHHRNKDRVTMKLFSWDVKSSLLLEPVVYNIVILFHGNFLVLVNEIMR